MRTARGMALALVLAVADMAIDEDDDIHYLSTFALALEPCVRV